MKIFLCFFKESGKVTEQEIMYGSCGCPIRPLLGEAVYHENERYIVVDVSWDYNEQTCYISAIYQEVEDDDSEEVHRALEEGAGPNSVPAPAGTDS